jgi:thioredoxin-like negative regulator of GroEL
MKQVSSNNNKITKHVITEIETRDKFFAILKSMNPGLFIIKLGASWCGPCKQIAPVIDGFFATSPPNVLCADIDVDQCFNLYSFLKSKQMVNGIPAILCYHKGNENYIPNDIVTGADPKELHKFFKRCGNTIAKHIHTQTTQTKAITENSDINTI